MLKSPLVLVLFVFGPSSSRVTDLSKEKKTLLSSYCRVPFVTFDTAISRA